jgi:S-adenosylmethionine:tRNA ribosyltransferase-isomerase
VRAQVGASKSPKPAGRITLDDGTPLTVLRREGEFYDLRFDTDEPVERVLLRAGRMPLPPYITRAPDAADEARYQTVFARHPGAVAAPTAGLHFDAALLARLEAMGVEFGHVTLHVGAGTFQPMRAESVADHVMHREWLNVGAELCERIARTRARGGRVVAVGTTVVRALEHAAAADGTLRAGEGVATQRLGPESRLRVVDAILSGTHERGTSHYELLRAFLDDETLLRTTGELDARGYLTHEFGDSVLIERVSG